MNAPTQMTNAHNAYNSLDKRFLKLVMIHFALVASLFLLITGAVWAYYFSQRALDRFEPLTKQIDALRENPQEFKGDPDTMMAELQQLKAALGQWQTRFYVISAATGLLAFFVTVFFMALGWCVVRKEQFSFKVYKKYLALGIVWLVFWMIADSILFLLLAFFGVHRILWGLLLFVPLYFTLAINRHFDMKTSAWKLFWRGFAHGARDFNKMIVPFVLIVFLFYLLPFVLNNALQVASSITKGIVQLVVLLSYVSWLKVYAFSVSIKKEVRHHASAAPT